MRDTTNLRAVSRCAVRLGWQAMAAVLGMVACGLAAGQDWSVHPALTDRWTVQLGAYSPQLSTTSSLNGNGGRIGTSTNFEDDLNLADRKTMPTFLASVRLWERWRIEGEYLTLNRGGSRAIGRTINWGNNTYNFGTTVTSEFDTDIYRLSVGYSFVKDSQKELGAALGLHVTKFDASLSAPVAGAAVGDTLAPLPTIGAYGAYAFTPRWLLSGRIDYFSLNYNEYSGSLTNFNAGVDYRFTRNFGVGLGYRYINYDLTATKTNFNGAINYKFNGPMVYGVASF